MENRNKFRLVLLLVGPILMTVYDPGGVSAQPSSSYLPDSIRELNLSDNFEKMIADEGRLLDKVSGFSTPIRITSGAIEADPRWGILVNKTALQTHFSESQMHLIRDVIRIVLAHEKAHWIQYRDARYGIAVRNWGFERKRIVECQADILAGKYWREAFGIEAFAKRVNGIARTSENDTFFAKDVLQMAFDLGRYESSSNSSMEVHPSRQARRVAFRIGMAVGGIALINEEIRRLMRQPASEQRDGEINAFRNLVNEIARKTEHLPGSNILAWSYWQASRIVHHSLAACLDIGITLVDVQWKTKGDRPKVVYTLKVKNNGSRAIQGDFAIQCDWTPKDDILNTKDKLLIDIKSYRFRLDTGQEKTITDSLNWTNMTVPNPEAYLPVLVYPPLPTSLMKFEYVDFVKEEERPRDETGYKLKIRDDLPRDLKAAAQSAKVSKKINDSMAKLLSAYLPHADNGYKNLVSSPSLRSFLDADSDKIVQFGDTPYENIVETRIISSASKKYNPFVSVCLYRAAGQAEQDEIFRYLKTAFPTLGVLRATQPPAGVPVDAIAAFSYAAEREYVVMLVKAKGLSAYEVNLIISDK